MYYIDEIPANRLTVKEYVKKKEEKNIFYNVIHEFLTGENPDDSKPGKCAGMFPQLNKILLECYQHTENEGLPLFEFVYDKHTSEEDVKIETMGKYHYDFHIKASTYSQKSEKSMGYRITCGVKKQGTPTIGVRATSVTGDPGKSWRGEETHKGGLSSFHEFTLGRTGVGKSREIFMKGKGFLICWGSISVVVNETSLNVFFRRSGQRRNIISFMQCWHVNDDSKYAWLSNGWRGNIADFDMKSKADSYITNKAKRSRINTVWQKEYLTMDGTTKDSEWYIPNLRITEEVATNNAREYDVEYSNLSLPLKEKKRFYMCVLNTLPTGTKRILSIE